MDHPEKFRRGVYRVTVTRSQTVEIEIMAACEEDARFDAVILAKRLPDDKWDGDGDYDLKMSKARVRLWGRQRDDTCRGTDTCPEPIDYGEAAWHG
jgi:hypothetical protein